MFMCELKINQFSIKYLSCLEMPILSSHFSASLLPFLLYTSLTKIRITLKGTYLNLYSFLSHHVRYADLHPPALLN